MAAGGPQWWGRGDLRSSTDYSGVWRFGVEVYLFAGPSFGRRKLQTTPGFWGQILVVEGGGTPFF